MKRLINSRLFCLLTEPSRIVGSAELQTAYDDFVESILIQKSDKTDLLFLHQELAYTRIELQALTLNSVRAGKKCGNA